MFNFFLLMQDKNVTTNVFGLLDVVTGWRKKKWALLRGGLE